MRIVAGEFRGRALKSPTWEGLRPTSDRLRETLFNILGPTIHGASVLDGFAGTGAIGIEALSRGAARVVFVERDPRAVQLIEANLAPLLASDRPKPVIIRAGFADAVRRLAAPPNNEVFDVIVLDPPYAEHAAAEALEAALPLVSQGAATRLIIEHGTRHTPPAGHSGLRLTRTVTAGDSALSFYER
jgi:16S rRNA (guanine966-N2)-methyltransferase